MSGYMAWSQALGVRGLTIGATVLSQPWTVANRRITSGESTPFPGLGRWLRFAGEPVRPAPSAPQRLATKRGIAGHRVDSMVHVSDRGQLVRS